MRICYYDLDEVSEGARAAAFASGPIDLEVAPAGTDWPPGAPTPQTVDAIRSNEFYNEMMVEVDALVEAWTRTGHASRLGICLPEIARYRLVFGFGRAEHRRWALAQIQQRFAPTEVVWVCHASAINAEELGAFTDGAAAHGIRLTPIVRGELPPLLLAWKRRLGNRVAPVLGRAREIQRRKAPSARLREVDVLFAEFFPNSTRAVLPIARRLRDEHGQRVIFLAGRDVVARSLSSQDIPVFRMPDLVGRSRYLRAGGGRDDVDAAIAALPADVLAGHALSQLGMPRYVAATLRRHLRLYVREAAYWVDALDAALAATRPKLLISSTFSSPFGRACAFTAGRRGIPTAFVQHGNWPAEPVNTFIPYDLKLVWGDHERRGLMKWGHPDASITVTGSTVYDAAKPAEMTRDAAGPLHVVYLASRSGGDVVSLPAARAILRGLLRAVDAVPGSQLTVKPHPSDITGLIEDELRYRPDVRIEKERSSMEMATAGDVIVVVSSTSGYDACLAGKPLVVYNLTGMPGYEDFTAYGAAIEVTNADSLGSILSQLSGSSELADRMRAGRQRFIADMLAGCDGRATERAAGALLDLLRRRGSGAA